jgi:hypothetical protein
LAEDLLVPRLNTPEVLWRIVLKIPKTPEPKPLRVIDLKEVAGIVDPRASYIRGSGFKDLAMVAVEMTEVRSPEQGD